MGLEVIKAAKAAKAIQKYCGNKIKVYRKGGKLSDQTQFEGALGLAKDLESAKKGKISTWLINSFQFITGSQGSENLQNIYKNLESEDSNLPTEVLYKNANQLRKGDIINRRSTLFFQLGPVLNALGSNFSQGQLVSGIHEATVASALSFGTGQLTNYATKFVPPEGAALLQFAWPMAYGLLNNTYNLTFGRLFRNLAANLDYSLQSYLPGSHSSMNGLTNARAY